MCDHAERILRQNMSANSFTEDGKDISTMKINCVILNYNDAETVEKLVRQIEKYSVLDGIVLVDKIGRAHV